MNAGRLSPSVALAAYAEAWINGAKVVVFGDALSLLAERLIERGARHVQVYDADAARAAEASAASTLKQVSHAPLELAGSALRDGVFDVAIVEDLASARENPKGLLEILTRALSRRGVALIGSRNSDVPERLITASAPAQQPLGYYDFYDLVSQHFEEVRMLGQTPFVGYAIADFSAADASEVRIDTALLPGGAEEPEWFLALASALPVSPDAFSVIQLPIAELDLGASNARAAQAASSDDVARAEGKIAELEAALAALATEATREAEKHAAERLRDAEKFAAERARDAEKFSAERAREAEKHGAERARDAAERAREAEKHGAERARDAAERARDAEKFNTERTRDAEKFAADRARATDKLAAERARDAERVAAERAREGGEKQSFERSRDAERRELERSFAEKLGALKAELGKREEWSAALESRAATADERADAAQAELDQRSLDLRKSREQLSRVEHQLEEERRARIKLDESGRSQKQELDRSARRAEAEVQRSSELAAESKKLAARVAELASALATSEKKLERIAEEGDEEARAELGQLEASLKERAAEVARLGAALHETERFGRELIVKLAELGSACEPVAPSPELDALRQRNAELSADLEAARWTISSLEANVADGHPGSSPVSAVESSSPVQGQLRDEIPPAEPAPLPSTD
jgi:hypothetical protein